MIKLVRIQSSITSCRPIKVSLPIPLVLVGSEESPAKSTADVFLIMLLTHKLILDAPLCKVGKSNSYDTQTNFLHVNYI